MKRTRYSVEVDSTPTALASCLHMLADGIPDFDYDYTMSITAGGIDYGIYLNIDLKRQEIEISNQPYTGLDGDDYISDIIANFEDEDDEDEEDKI